MKRICFAFLVVAILSACSKDENPAPKNTSPGSWTQLPDFPGDGKSSGIAFTINGKGYWGLGSSDKSSFPRDFWSFDPTTGVWERKKDFPYMNPMETAVVVGNKAYAFAYSGDLFEYDPAFDSWKMMASFPLGIRGTMTSFSVEGKAYFGIGIGIVNQTATAMKDFWEYDPTTDKWKQIADFPGEGRSAAVSFVIGSKGYVGIGYNNSAPPSRNDVWSYEPKTNKWKKVADYPDTKSIPDMCFSNNTNAFIGQIEMNDSHPAAVYEYSPNSDSWRQVSTPPGLLSLTRSFFIDGRMFVMGGFSGAGHSKQVWEFVP
jgi:N-acetylneuraminic acid mutarotase